jgi:type VI secretion system secreted protein Hcp
MAGISGMHAPAAEAATVALSGASAGAVSYFLKLDGVPGESTDASHKGEIDLLAFSWGVSNPGSAATGTGRAGKPSFSDFNFETLTSKASPLLMLNTASGKVLASAVVTGRKNGAEGGVNFLKIVLTDVLVASYEQSASSEVPTESASLSYTKIQYSITTQTASGEPGTTTTATWDLRSNKV